MRDIPHELEQRPVTSPASGSSMKRWELLVSALFILGCILTSIVLLGRLDIGLYDETAYLQRGAWIDKQGLPTADMAPLYSLWYRSLQFIVSDPIQRYFANYAFTMAALPVLAFALLRISRVALLPSLVTGVFVLLSNSNVLNWPRVSVFALIILLIGLILFLRSERRDRGWFAITAATAVVQFIRPEFALSLMVLGALWLFDLVRRKRGGGLITWSYPLAALVLIAALFVWLGNPFANGRSMIAFGQHYALNVIDAGETHVDPWTNWETIAQKDLGTTESLTNALRNAPDRVVWHVLRNVSQALPTWARMYLPAGARMTWHAWVLLIISAAALLIQVQRVRRAPSDAFMRILPIVGALCLPALLSAIVIHPRQHYLLFPAVLLLLMLVRSAYRPRPARTSGTIPWVPGLAALLLMGLHLGRPIAPQGRPNLATIHALRSITSTKPMIILEADGGYDAYLPPGTERIKAQAITTGFSDLLNDSAVNIIVSSPRLERDHRFLEDPEWRHFRDGGYRSAFNEVAVRGTTTRLFVRRSILVDQP
ncbi:MAG: hypothetical protein JNN32_13260 [Flavobacteriales bacterium]|nr:hypothetical protein [Flavobacteriales bacterium]